MSSPRPSSSPPAVAPPTPQEVHRKLSIHAAGKPKMAVPGTESDSDSHSVFAPEHVASSSAQPLSAIAERLGIGEDSEDDDEEEEGEHEHEHDDDDDEEDEEGVHGEVRKAGQSDIKAGYLWKKGERRKTWKRRWFVLRAAHLAYYKTSAEYQLHRLLDLGDVHTCTPVALKKHAHAFGVVAPARTFYLQAESEAAMHEWVRAVRAAKEALQGAPASAPIDIPGRAHATPSPPPPPPLFHGHAVTSSESEDASPRVFGAAAGALPASPRTPGRDAGGAKAVVSGYVMKLGSKRRNWRKRWFVLNGEKLMYSGSHMDTKPHRQIPLAQILDAFEYELPGKAGAVPGTPLIAPPHVGGEEGEGAGTTHTFKIVTTKRTLLLCAPSEEEEIKWLSAVRALLARREGGGDGGVGSHGHGQGSGSGSGGVAKNRREAPPRKASVSGTAAFTPGAAAPIAEESVS